MDIYSILNTTVGAFSNAAVAIFVCAMALYFIVEFKTKSNDSDFSFGYWIKDNWINLLTSVILFVMYNYSSEYVRATVLFMIAFGSNYMIDALITYRYKKLNQ